jgi:hypothetical protein
MRRRADQVECIMDVAGQHGQYVAPGQFAQGAVAVSGKGVAARPSLDQRMVAGDDGARTGGQSIDPRQAIGQGLLPDIALGPVQPPLRPRRGLERHDRHAGQGERLFQHAFDRTEAAIGIEKALDRIEIGQVVIAHFHRDRHVERVNPLAGGGEFAVPGAHRQVTGDGHGIGAFLLHAIDQPGQGARIFQAEVNVADMKDAGHLC